MHDVQDLICHTPPKKMILLSIIQDELSKRGDHRVLTFDEKHMLDVDWCLHAVSALNPQHRIFDPDYMPSQGERGRRGIRYIPKDEDFIFQEPTSMNNEYAKNGYNGPKFTQDAPKEHAQGGIYSARNVSF